MNVIKKKSFFSTQNKTIALSKINWNKAPLIKKMIKGRKNVAGRNNSGKITVFHRGGGHKKNTEKLILYERKIQWEL